MKTIYRNISFLVASFSLLCACTSSLDEVTSQPDPVSFSLSVSVDNYTPAGGGAETRAADAYPVTFANGDRLGLTALDVSGNIVTGYNNVPFTYKDGKWSPAAPVPFSAAYRYLVYYPYQEAMSDKKTKDKIIAASSPLADQRSAADHRVSDLLVCDLITPQAGDKTLNVAFQHAFSLLVIPAVKATITSEGTKYQCGLSVIDPGITVGTEVYLPYVASDGTARCVVKPQSDLSLKGYFSCDGKLYSSSASSVALAANCYYAFKELNTSVTYGLDRMQAGDFYCSAAEGKAYLIPYNAVSLPIDANCLGIVYWVGDPTNTANGDPLLKTQHSGCTHGLVVALQDAGRNLLWSSEYEDITSNWLSSQSTTYGITSLKEQNKMQGYANTQALIGYNAVHSNDNYKVLPIEAITTTYASAHPTPASSSGWYFPSVMELKYMCWGQGNSSGTAGRDLLNTQLGKVPGASSLQSFYYWSSTERDYSWAWVVYFSDGYVDYDGNKSYNSFGVRAVLAF